MSSLKEQLYVLDDLLRGQHHPVCQYLMPGLPEEEIRGKLEEHGLLANRELLNFFGWHNGTDLGAQVLLNHLWISRKGYPLGLQEALDTRENTISIGWQIEDWLPLFGDGGGAYMFADLRNKSADTARIYDYLPELHEIEVFSASLLDFISTIVRLYETKVLYFDKNLERVEMNTLDFAKVAKEMNPTIERWQYDDEEWQEARRKEQGGT